MNIVCCTDHNYVMPTGVMICSVCVNHLDCNVSFHVVCNDDVTENDKKDLSDIVLKYHHQIFFYTVNIKIPDCFTVNKEGQPKHITISTYYRMFLVQILPSNVEKVIYLDCDIVVRHSLQEMYDTDIKDYAVGVIPDMGDGKIYFYNYLRYSPRYGYFNAGVLLLNLLYWKENDILQKCIDFASEYPERVILHDQDIMNFVLKDSKYQLSLTYNFQHGFLFRYPYISWEYENELHEAIKDPYILHFTGKKPWVKGCDHPYRNEFLKYRQMTKWRNEPLWRTNPITWRQRVKSILMYVGILKRPASPYISVNPL